MVYDFGDSLWLIMMADKRSLARNVAQEEGIVAHDDRWWLMVSHGSDAQFGVRRGPAKNESWQVVNHLVWGYCRHPAAGFHPRKGPSWNFKYDASANHAVDHSSTKSTWFVLYTSGCDKHIFCFIATKFMLWHALIIIGVYILDTNHRITTRSTILPIVNVYK